MKRFNLSLRAVAKNLKTINPKWEFLNDEI